MSANNRLVISLDDVRLYGYHGVLEQENRVGAEYELCASVCVDMPPGCITDDIVDTLSYADLYAELKSEFDLQCNLLESLVNNMAHRVLNRWRQVSEVYIKVSKLAPPIPSFRGKASVAITLTR